MDLAKILAILTLVGSLLLPAALPTAQAQRKKGVGDKVNITPSIIGGAALKLDREKPYAP